MRAGETRVVDLAAYLRPGVGDPVPTVLEATQLTRLDVDIDVVSATEVQITTGAGVSGSAQFRVVMSDVARADTGPERQVEGRITLDVLDVPDAPDRTGARQLRRQPAGVADLGASRRATAPRSTTTRCGRRVARPGAAPRPPARSTG